MSSISPVIDNHVPVLETGFTPWDEISDFFSIFDSTVCDPVEINPGLEKTNSCQIQNRTVSTVHEDQRKKRKLSNRESARRSRIKKQKYLEDVRCELNHLKKENRDLLNRFRYVLSLYQREKMVNDQLRLEYRVLHEKLLNVRQVLVLRQIQQSSTCATWSSVDSTVVTVQQNPVI